MRPGAIRLAAAFALAALASGALAATPAAPGKKPEALNPPAATEPTAAPPPAYEPQLLRLAEVIGALSFLRDLCGDGDGDAFRSKFASLLETEGATPARKETLAGAFNRGLRGYEMTYRSCTPAAREIIARFLAEAARIAKDVANRYGS